MTLLCDCRVSPNKVLPKKNPSFVKKVNTTSPSCSLNLSPQPLMLTEKSSLHDKSLMNDKGKFKFPERPQQGGLSLPEVRGATEGGYQPPSILCGNDVVE